MVIHLDSRTPDKSRIITKFDGKAFEQRVKFINKKGSFQKREQCNECRFKGRVQTGLRFTFDISCDREEGFWKARRGSTEKPCKYFQQKKIEQMFPACQGV